MDGGYGLYYINGKLIRYDSQDEDFNTINEALWELANLDENDYPIELSLYDYLISIYTSEEMIKVAINGYANTLCCNIKELSLCQVIRWSRMWNHGSDEEEGDYRFTNSYKCLIDHFINEITKQSNKRSSILINKPVTDIIHGLEDIKYPVIVNTMDGIEYNCKCVVLTASPHVLRSGLITFDPPLSNDKSDALKCVVMHPVVKVLLKFSQICWPKSVQGMIMVDDNFMIPEVWFRSVGEIEGEEAVGYCTGFAAADFAENIISLPQEEVFQSFLEQVGYSKLYYCHLS